MKCYLSNKREIKKMVLRKPKVLVFLPIFALAGSVVFLSQPGLGYRIVGDKVPLMITEISEDDKLSRQKAIDSILTDLPYRKSQPVTPKRRLKGESDEMDSDISDMITGSGVDGVGKRQQQMNNRSPKDSWDKGVLKVPELLDDPFTSEPSCEYGTFVVVIITSSPENFDRRDAIRNTWASHRNSTEFRAVFMVGAASNDFLEEMLEREGHKHGDMLRGSYIDSYQNLTLKTLHGLRWSWACRPTYLLKTDDDCFVNRRVLLTFLHLYNLQTTNLYAGRLTSNAEVVRTPNSKWFVPRSDYKLERYPPYASGIGYILSGDVIGRIVQASKRRKPFANEDAYVGVLAHDIGLTPVHSDRFALSNSHWTICNYKYLCVIHSIDAQHQYSALDMSEKSTLQCKAKDVLTW